MHIGIPYRHLLPTVIYFENVLLSNDHSDFKFKDNCTEKLYSVGYSHCQVVQLFRLTSLLTKGITTIITKHIFSPCVRFSVWDSSALIYQNERNTFSKLFLLK